MRLVREELRKIGRSPVLYFLLIGAICWNSAWVVQNASSFQTLLQLAKEEEVFLSNSTNRVEELRAAERPFIDQLDPRAATLMEALSYRGYTLEEEQERLFLLAQRSLYWETHAAQIQKVEAFESSSYMDQQVAYYRLSGPAKEQLKHIVPQMEERMEQIKKENIQAAYVPNALVRQHSALFGQLLFFVLIEALLFSILFTARLTAWEEEERTAPMIYPTKYGRRLYGNKLLCALLVSCAVYLILSFSALALYFYLTPYGAWWHQPVSSSWNGEGDSLFVTWFDWTFQTYMIAHWFVALAILLLIVGYTWVCTLVVKWTYASVLTVLGGLVALFIAPGFMPVDSRVVLWSHYTLSTLIMNMKSWFVLPRGIMTAVHYEVITLASATFLLFLVSGLAITFLRTRDWREKNE